MSNLRSVLGCSTNNLFHWEKSVFQLHKGARRGSLLVIHQRESADLRYKVRYDRACLLSSDKAPSDETLGFEAADQRYTYFIAAKKGSSRRGWNLSAAGHFVSSSSDLKTNGAQLYVMTRQRLFCGRRSRLLMANFGTRRLNASSSAPLAERARSQVNDSAETTVQLWFLHRSLHS